MLWFAVGGDACRPNGIVLVYAPLRTLVLHFVFVHGETCSDEVSVVDFAGVEPID